MREVLLQSLPAHTVPPSGRSGFQGRFSSYHCAHAGAAKSARVVKKRSLGRKDISCLMETRTHTHAKELHSFNTPWEGPIALTEAKLMLI